MLANVNEENSTNLYVLQKGNRKCSYDIDFSNLNIDINKWN